MRIPGVKTPAHVEGIAPTTSLRRDVPAAAAQQNTGTKLTAPQPPTACVGAIAGSSSPAKPSYLFAQDYSVEEIFTDPRKAQRFSQQYLEREAKFFALARHPQTGLTYDGVNLDAKTGEVEETRPFSAPSKECLDMGLCLKALSGDPQAAAVVGKGDVQRAKKVAVDILSKKLASYEAHHQQNPGYGGFLPWFKADGGPVRPTDDWLGDVPGLDNGEWVWTMLVAESTLRNNGHTELADGYGRFNALLRSNVVDMFFDRDAGKVRADVHVVDPRSPDSAYETIRDKPGRMTHLTGEHGVHEGVMMALYVTLFGDGLPDGAADRVWADINMKAVEHEHGTTWEAYWGSSHESWTYLFLPFRDIQGYRDLFRIREKIRTQYAADNGFPGLATSTNEPGDGGYVGYLDGAGVDGIGSQAIRNNHVYAIYGAFPLLLEFAEAKSGNVGLAWLLNMLHAPKAQGPLGGGESGTNDGTAASTIKTIDGSFPNVLAMTGGIADQTADMLREHGLYDAFIERMQAEYDEVFAGAPLNDPSNFALPTTKVPRGRLTDFVPKAPLVPGRGAK